MNPEVKAKWLTALRSGEYDQATGRLVKVNPEGGKSYCCLGVLCDIAVQEGVTEWGGGGFNIGIPFPYTVDDDDDAPEEGLETTGLPAVVREWAGVDWSNGRLDGEGVQFTVPSAPNGFVQHAFDLVTLNDDAAFNFSRIADVIEERL